MKAVPHSRALHIGNLMGLSSIMYGNYLYRIKEVGDFCFHYKEKEIQSSQNVLDNSRNKKRRYSETGRT